MEIFSGRRKRSAVSNKEKQVFTN